MNYNLKRHIELLKYSQNLENQGKSLYIENREEDLELSQYNIAVELHFFWQERDKVGLYMEDFLNKKIDGEELCDRICGIRNQLMNKYDKFALELTYEKIKAFQPDERAKKLSGFLTTLYCECEDFEEDYENDEFYTSIKNGFLYFQKALTEE